MLAFPLLVVYFLSRVLGDRRYLGTLGQRLGFLPSAIRNIGGDAIWLHAVSVGEVLSSVRLVEELKRQQPALAVYVSTATVAGQSVARQKLEGKAAGVFYAPIDYAFAVRRVLRRIQPAAVIILETEIWPLLYREAKRHGCALVVVNGRISDRALPRYQALKIFFRWVLSLPDAIYVQGPQDKERYLSLGAPARRVEVLGNLKYDTAGLEAEPPQQVRELVAKLTPSRVLIAASTMPGAGPEDIDEDDLTVETFAWLAARVPGLLMIYAPRRPERFELAAQKLERAGVRYLRRSRMGEAAGLELPGVLLVDTLGELASIFELGDVVFLGGTVAQRGGHNLLEPAAAGKAVVCGPHLENFPAIAKEFRDAGAIMEIATAAGLGPAILKLMEEEERRASYGRKAKALAEAKRGVTALAARKLLEAMDEAVPMFGRRGIGPGILWGLSRIWVLGAAVDRHRETARARSLGAPVVSIGGLAMGGVGKTPLCAHLAERLAARGYAPAVLTRGYRRRSLEEVIVVEAGAQAPACMTGDEAQIFVRFAHAHVGIGRSRWTAGQLLRERLPTSVFLLDDGFQHYELKRDLDVVLIDALDPFSDGRVFPHGKLREPLSALRRAGCFVITRAQPNRNYSGIRAVLAGYNPEAPVFLARLEAGAWINERTKEPQELPDGAVVAFCGLGNPEAFWRTLRRLGIEPVFQWTFDDHHTYVPRELKRLARQARERGAQALVTTQKDAMNLPERAFEAIAPLDLFWVKVDVTLDKEEEFLDLIAARIDAHRERIRGGETEGAAEFY